MFVNQWRLFCCPTTTPRVIFVWISDEISLWRRPGRRRMVSIQCRRSLSALDLSKQVRRMVERISTTNNKPPRFLPSLSSPWYFLFYIRNWDDFHPKITCYISYIGLLLDIFYYRTTWYISWKLCRCRI